MKGKNKHRKGLLIPKSIRMRIGKQPFEITAATTKQEHEIKTAKWAPEFMSAGVQSSGSLAQRSSVMLDRDLFHY